MRSRARDSEAECVERLVEHCRPQLDGPEQRLGVDDRRTPGQSRGRAEPGRQRPDHAYPKGPRQRPEETHERRARQALERRVLVRVAVSGLGDTDVVDGERQPDERHPPRQLAFERERELPAGRAARLEQRHGVRPAKRLSPPRCQQDARPSVKHRLRRRDDDDRVRLDQLARRAQRYLSGRAQVDEVSLDVVDDHPTTEATGEPGGDQRLEIAPPGLPLQTARDDDRQPVVVNAEQAELLHRRRERLPAGIDRRAGKGQGRQLDDDRRPAAARNDVAKRGPSSGKLSASLTAVGMSAIDSGGGAGGASTTASSGALTISRRLPERSGIRALDGCYGIERWSLRNVWRKPRFGQNRDASRFVIRQSVIIVG